MRARRRRSALLGVSALFALGCTSGAPTGEHGTREGSPATEAVATTAQSIRTEPLHWGQRQKLFAADSGANDWFGLSTSLDGDTAIIGAPGHQSNSGSAYAFVRSAGVWSQQQKLRPSIQGAGRFFGYSVAVQGDTAVIGAYLDVHQGSQSGAAYVFTRSNGTWTEQQRLVAPDGAAGVLQFGHSVSLDGTRLVIGAPTAFDDDGARPGAVYAFAFDGTTWGFEQKLPAPDSHSGRFGFLTSLKGDRFVVGAPMMRNAADVPTGAAYVFERDGSGWSFVQKLLASDGTSQDDFGLAVALEGDTALIGAHRDGRGSVYVFGRDESTWTERRKLVPSDINVSAAFGVRVALDGDSALIGALGHFGLGATHGAAYVFARAEAGWVEEQILLPPVEAVGFNRPFLGSAAAVDGSTALVGAYTESISGAETGAVYVYGGGPPPGAPCNTGDDCGSGFCVQGVCCDTACAGPCESCLGAHTAGEDGICSFVLANSDPKNVCDDQGAASCGTTGTCPGNSSACRLYSANTVCAPSTGCSSATSEDQPDLCDGNGACVVNGAQACAVEYTCTDGSCRTMCSTNAHCSPGHACHAQSARCRKANGVACTAGTECASENCRDGVCCDTACNGVCQACAASLKQSGAESGVCGPAAAGTDPRNGCPDDGAASCDRTGLCNGAGACALYEAGTECGPASCASPTSERPPSSCDGSGTCALGAPLACAVGDACVDGACRTSCSTNGDCAPGFQCHVASGQCRRVNGAACNLVADCMSGICAQGVCCGSTCDSPCESCRGTHTGGSDGSCLPVLAGTDAKNACPNDGAASCGRTGVCNGSSVSCPLYAADTVCAAGSCPSPTAEDPADTCDGSGTCRVVAPAACLPGFACVGSACKTTCSGDGDCTGGNRCHVPSGQCRSPTGAPCTTAVECASGFCADGVCCETACSGACMSCRAEDQEAPASDGVCGAVAVETDPGNDCPDLAASSCGTTGKCDGAGACALYPAGTACGSGTCSGTLLISGASCDGAGTCGTTGGATDCTPYQCSPEGCINPCSSDDDCTAAHECEDGACVLPGSIGSACNAAEECLSGHCVDGVCCDGECTSACTACSAAVKGQGRNGVCGPVAGGLDPDDECAPDPEFPESCLGDGACDGAGACRVFAAAGTPCGLTTCMDGVVTGELCTGAGVCAELGSASCGHFACAPDVCGTSCDDDEDCREPAECAPNGACVAVSGPGASCETDFECASGYCADGACCDAPCTGQCEACDVAGSEGTCTAVTGSPHGAREACGGAGVGDGGECGCACDGISRTACVCAEDGAACGRAGTCMDGQCFDTVPVCISNTRSRAPDGTETSCRPYVCNEETGSCRTSCDEDDHCSPGDRCVAATCVPEPEDPGSAGSAGVAGSGGEAGARQTASGGTAGAANSGGAGEHDDGGSTAPANDGGCGCRAASRSSVPHPAWFLLSLAWFVGRRRGSGGRSRADARESTSV